ncbi:MULTISPECIES: hypothetical protein [Thiorhodovibrio]|uniref:hypothetical protein n=1 Tax=Thiorhodovibrio TaxID=61593 RepID=UPI0019116717|nr:MULTISPECIES: hypothetical protein [Thiorhodovibrio]MBK5969038.1 hypothetical protein [Thiorhodovibrio winogradskyi]WPL15081.1 hypothetical protein Thiosp_04945 [Thiorhodovibrio litoralis]
MPHPHPPLSSAERQCAAAQAQLDTTLRDGQDTTAARAALAAAEAHLARVRGDTRSPAAPSAHGPAVAERLHQLQAELTSRLADLAVPAPAVPTLPVALSEMLLHAEHNHQRQQAARADWQREQDQLLARQAHLAEQEQVLAGSTDSDAVRATLALDRGDLQRLLAAHTSARPADPERPLAEAERAWTAAVCALEVDILQAQGERLQAALLAVGQRLRALAGLCMDRRLKLDPKLCAAARLGGRL